MLHGSRDASPTRYRRARRGHARGMLAFAAVCVSLVLCAPTVALAVNLPVDFSDRNLEAVVRTALNEPTATIMMSDMQTLTSLNAQNKGIHTLDGLQHASNLTNLNLVYNEIATITPVGFLTKLKTLSIDENNISDISPISTLTTLTAFYASGNDITTITPVAGLTGLVYVSFANNSITTITPVAGLTKLEYLDLNGNRIKSISAVSGLSALKHLLLDANFFINDLSPLVGHTNLTELGLSNNNVVDLSPLNGLTGLRKLRIEYNAVTSLAPIGSLTGLTLLRATGNQLTTIAPVASLTNLEYLSLGDDNVTSVMPLLGLSNLKELSLYMNEISSVDGLGVLNKLETLGLGKNQITSIEPLRGMPSLTNLSIWDNPLTSIAPVSSLTTLTALDIGNLGLSDLTPVSGLHNLRTLQAYGNHFSDLTPLSGMTSLDQVYFAGNDITDISPLLGLPLTYAGVPQNWLYLAPGSQARLTLDALLAKPCAVEYYDQHAGGVLVGTARSSSGGALGGVTLAVAGGPNAVTAANGTFVAGLAQPGVRTLTFSKPYYSSYVMTLSVDADTTHTVDATLTPVQLPLTIKRSPTGYGHTYRRKHGVARFTFSATLIDARGVVAGKRVYLQTKKSGGSWKTGYTMITDSKGKASHRFAARKKGTTYYRWVSKANAYDMAKTLPSQKVVVK